MNSLLITVATPAIAPHIGGFLTNQREYARAQSLTHILHEDNPYPDLHPSFAKVPHLLAALETDAPYIICADIDVAFMDHTKSLQPLVDPPYFLAAYHQRNWPNWPYLCAGLTLWRNCETARTFVREWLRRVETRLITYHPWEQWYFDELIRERSIKEGSSIVAYDGIRICKEHEIGCFCPSLWHDSIIWQPTYPTMHFAGPHLWPDRADHLLRYLPLVKKAHT